MEAPPFLPPPDASETGYGRCAGDASRPHDGRRRLFAAGDRRPSKRKLVEDEERGEEDEGGAAAVVLLRAELEEERAAAATAASEAMAMILRLQREKGLLLMEMRQFRRVAEEKMSYQEQQLRALSDELRACRRRLLSHGIPLLPFLSPGGGAVVSGEEGEGEEEEEDEDEEDRDEEEVAEIGSLEKRVQAVEAEIRKISRRFGEEEPSSSSSSSPCTPQGTAMMAWNPPRRWGLSSSSPASIGAALAAATPIKIKIKIKITRLIEKTVPQWILSLVGSRKTGGAAAGLLFLLLIGFLRRTRQRRRLKGT